MGEDIINGLVEDPTQIFTPKFKDSNYFDVLVKHFVDPIAEYSKLDEIFIDGLDASQVFGQTKLVAESAARAVLESLDEIRGSEEEGNEESDSDQSSNEEQNSDQESDELENEEAEEEGEGSEGEDEIDNGMEGFNDSGAEEEEIKEDDDAQSNTNESDIVVKKDAFGLNDQFFDIDEFNKQIVSMENEENDDNDEDVDYFNEVDDDDDEIDYFDDFYEKPLQITLQKPKQLMESEDEGEVDQEEQEDQYSEESFDEEEYNNAIGEVREDLFEEKSSFEKQQEKLQKEINQLEDELVAEKKWTMKGEVKSNQRPEDSLLNDQEDFDFERIGKPVPIITEEITESIEDLIRKRIKNDEFDDLPKRFLNEIIKPEKQRVEVSETKSSKSLAEIYEDKYKGVEDTSKQEKLTQEHHDIQELFNSVNYKLDSLTSFNFVPKPHENKVIEVKSSTIDMEDAQPEFVSEESRLAPQEVFNKDAKNPNEIALKSGLSYSRDELSREEKPRLRRANKRRKSKQFKDSQAKKSRNESVLDTLSSNKNLTVIGKSGQKTDIKGNLRKEKTVTSNNLKL